VIAAGERQVMQRVKFGWGTSRLPAVSPVVRPSANANSAPTPTPKSKKYDTEAERASR
jgi:hypothetical protein